MKEVFPYIREEFEGVNVPKGIGVIATSLLTVAMMIVVGLITRGIAITLLDSETPINNQIGVAASGIIPSMLLITTTLFDRHTAHPGTRVIGIIMVIFTGYCAIAAAAHVSGNAWVVWYTLFLVPQARMVRNTRIDQTRLEVILMAICFSGWSALIACFMIFGGGGHGNMWWILVAAIVGYIMDHWSDVEDWLSSP